MWQEKLQSWLEQAELSEQSRRLFHGRGHCYPAWEWLSLDWYSPIVVATLYKNPGEAAIELLKQGLNDVLNQRAGIKAVFIQYRFSHHCSAQWLGEKPEQPVYARRGELKFLLTLSERQNLGYFLDMEAGRQWLEKNTQGRGLNLFSYTCALSAVALQAGASEVVNVDMSKGALTTGQKNHQLNDLRGGRFYKMDVFKAWKKLQQQGPYNWIVVDPPSFQKGSFIAEKDYARLISHLAKVVSPGTQILACLNSPELDLNFLQQCFSENLPQAKFIERLVMSDDFPELDINKGLKICVFKII